MNFMPQIAEFSGQVVDINALPSRIGITAIGKQTDFQGQFLQLILGNSLLVDCNIT
jgi:hypothetical protein